MGGHMSGTHLGFHAARDRPWIGDPLRIDFTEQNPTVLFEGFSGPEPIGRWASGRSAIVRFRLQTTASFLYLLVTHRGFIVEGKVPVQNVIILANDRPASRWAVRENYFRIRPVLVELDRATAQDIHYVTLRIDTPDAISPSALGEGADTRTLSVMIRDIAVRELHAPPEPDSLLWELGRSVGGEAAKSFDTRVLSGFWERFFPGPRILDVGFRGYLDGIQPIAPTAIGIDLDYPGYDGKRLPFDDGSQDAVFSSHCLEHVSDYVAIIQDWFRVVRVGGFVIIVVPDGPIYERRRRPPSRWNDDHKRTYSCASLLIEIEAALAPNTFRVRHLEENDAEYRYTDPPDVHPFGCYEIVLVIEKIESPAWIVAD